MSGVFPWVVSGGECLCLALGGVCLQVVIRAREDEVERLTLAVLCLYLGVACGPGWFVSMSVSISCQCLWAVLCVTMVRYWNLLCLVCFRGWCQAVSVVSCSWRCVFASCDWRETTK